MKLSRQISILAAALIAALSMLAFASTATAQWNDGGFFFLRDPFGPQMRRPPPPPSYYPREQLPRVQQPAEPEGGTIYGSAEAADKHRATQAEYYVVVFGDSLADQLAQGLADAFFEERPEIAIIKKTRGSSGLVRSDFYDWPAQVPVLLENEKAHAIVVMLGTNDRQALRDEKGTYEIRSDRWRELYAQRADAMIEAAKAKGVPVIVVGQPAMMLPRLHADMPYINEILRERAAAKSVLYVDVWDGFVNESDQFMTMGPALDGQIRRLRIADGVHFTRAGARKLAHYVERDLVKLFSGAPGSMPLIPQQDQQEQSAPAGRPVAGPVVPLTQPAGPVGGLAGGGQAARSGGGIASRVLVEGAPAEPVAGRADDFRWPRTEVKIVPQERPGAAKNAPAQQEQAAKPAPALAGETPPNSGQLPRVITPSRDGPKIITVPEAQPTR
jgi:hypothetical protein